MRIKNNQLLDLLILVFLLVISPFIILHFEFSFFVSTIIYFLVPSIFLLLRKPRAIHETLGASILLGFILGIWFDIFAELTNAWAWLKPQEFYIPFSYMGIVPGDVIFWLILWVFQIVVFYEHFFIHSHSGGFSPRWKKGLTTALCSLGIISVTFLTNSKILNIPYTYFMLSFVVLIIGLWIIIHRPSYIKPMLLISLYFIPLYTIFEITSLKLGHWGFPGEYIFKIQMGNYSVPFEEIFFWIILSSPILLLFYKWWVDDDTREKLLK